MRCLWITLRHSRYPVVSLSLPNLPHLPSPTFTCHTLYSTDPWKQSHAPSRGSHAHPPHPPKEGIVKRGWRKLATLVSAFMTGTKGLYSDVKVMNELKKRQRFVITGSAPNVAGTTDFKFNRTEVQFIYQTHKDVKKMLPTIILFFVPTLGYFVPLIVFMYPQRMLSSHFLTADQKSDLLQSTNSDRAGHIQALLSDSDCSKRLTLLRYYLKIEGEWGGEDVGREGCDEITTQTLRRVKGQQLERLCGMWGVAGGVWLRLLPWGRNSALQSRLESHLNFIFTCDWLVRAEGGVASAEREDLEKLCVERCLMVETNGEDMKEYLQRWIDTSTHFTECPSYLLAHLPLLLLSPSQPTNH